MQLTTTSTFRITGAEGEYISGDLHLPGPHAVDAPVGAATSGGRVPLVIVMHGFKGFKDWGPWAPLCDRFCDNGIAALRFNLSHNGVGLDGEDYSALDKFERNTIAAELFDLHEVIDRVRTEQIIPPDRIDLDRIFLLGHSRGGAGVLLSANEDGASAGRAPGGLAGIITWAAISTYERGWAVEAIEIWERGESVPVLNSRTKQMMPLGPELYQDYQAHKSRYDIEVATRSLGRSGIPLLVVHGTEDQTVPCAEATEVCRWYEAGGGSEVELVEIIGGDHTLGSRHPFDGWPDALETAFDRSLKFIQARI